MKNFILVLVVSLIYLQFSQSLYIQQQTLTSSNGNFGSSLILQGNFLAVSSLNGNVYTYTKNGSNSNFIATSILSGQGSFGISLAMQGNTLIISQISSIFVYNSLTLVQNLSGNDTVSSDRFGSAVSLSGNLLAVGASTKNTDGAVYIFSLNSSGLYNQIMEIPSPYSSGSGAQFGNSLVLVNNTLVVAAPGSNSVAFITLTENSWTLQNLSGNGISSFGISLSFDGNTIAVGAPSDNQGSVFLYDGAGNFQTKLNPQITGFGVSLYISGNTLVVSSSPSSTIFNYNGSNWNTVQTISISVGSICISGTTMVMGRPGGYTSGVVYVFDFQFVTTAIQTTSIQTSSQIGSSTSAPAVSTVSILAHSSPRPNIVAIAVGVSVGGFLCLFCLLLLLILLLLRKKKQHKKNQDQLEHDNTD